MFGYFFKALAIMGIIAAWSEKALADGKVTAAEGFDLLEKLAESLGLPMAFEVPELSERLAAAAPLKPVSLVDDDPHTRD